MNGVFAMTAVTALTAQNTTGVRDVLEVSPRFLGEQLDAVFEDIPPDAVKVGMVSSAVLIDMIAEKLRFYRAKNIVVDPVMVATSGARLIRTEAVEALKKVLFPLATLITPNIPEAEVLADRKIRSEEEIRAAAERIARNTGAAVLVKGGHRIRDAEDILCYKGKIVPFHGKRVDNPNTHGTGCTLSGAIAANLAKGFALEESIARAKEYITAALEAGLDLGKGSGPLQHNFALNGYFAEESSHLS